MVAAKERYGRCASIRRHVLLYAKRNDLSELDKALAELKILMNLAEPAPHLPREGRGSLKGQISGEFMTQGVTGDLTDEENDGFPV